MDKTLWLTFWVTMYIHKPVDELVRALLSAKRPTRHHNCDRADYWQFSVGDRVTPNTSSPRGLSQMTRMFITLFYGSVRLKDLQV